MIVEKMVISEVRRYKLDMDEQEAKALLFGITQAPLDRKLLVDAGACHKSPGYYNYSTKTIKELKKLKYDLEAGAPGLISFTDLRWDDNSAVKFIEKPTTAPVEVIKKEPTAAEVLKKVVALLNSGNDESEKLWAVLTALRGPDRFEGLSTGDARSSEMIAKEATTAVIRSKLGIGEHIGVRYSLTVNDDSSEHAAARKSMHDHGRKNEHFNAHMMTAFEALGMSWHIKNSK